jgi:hypothetical protein
MNLSSSAPSDHENASHHMAFDVCGPLTFRQKMIGIFKYIEIELFHVKLNVQLVQEIYRCSVQE